MGVFLRAYDRNGAALGLMPDFTDLNVQTVDNEPGTMTFRYQKDGLLASLLDRDELFLSVNEDGVVSSDLFVLEDDTDDPVQTLTQTKRRWVTCSARGYMSVLEQAVVFPKGANAAGTNLYGLKPEYKFDDKSPGNIMLVLINEAKARGALTELQTDFVTATDSAGRAWPKTYDITYQPGANLLSVLTDMINDGWVDARMEGRKLRLFVPDTYFGTKTDMLRYGQNVTSAPRKRSRRNILSHVLAAGDAEKKATVQVANATTAARFGRREGFASDGRLTKTAALTSLANRELSTHQMFKEAFTLEMVMNPPGPGEGWPRPGIDFFVGDRIYYDRARINSTEYQPLLVRSITKAWGDTNRAATCSIELADLFVKQTARTAAQVAAIVNGSTGVRMPAPRAPQRDAFPPVGPSTVTVTGATDLFDEGVRKTYRSTATITWPAVDQDSDGTPLDDLDGYEVQVAVNGGPWSASKVSKDTQELVTGLKPLDLVRARVLAKDTSGNRSDWTLSVAVQMPMDLTAPLVPTVPVLTQKLGVVTCRWDGQGTPGPAAMPPDFHHVEVQRCLSNAFTTGVIVVDSLMEPDAATLVSGLPYGEAWWFRFVAVDVQGNRSVPGPAASIAVAPLVNGDLPAQVILDIENAKGTLNGWTFTGKTTINGGKIEADSLTIAAIKAGTIGVSKLAVADTANMVDVNETNPGIVQQVTGTTLVTGGYSARTDETVSTFRLGQKKGPIPFKQGERLRFTTRAYVTSGAVTATVRLWVFKSDDTVFPYQDLGTIALTTAPTNFTVEADITLDLTDRATYYLELAGVTNQPVRVQTTRCYRMGAGELLVDGSIQAKHMSANSVKADSIEAGAIDVDKITQGVLRSNLMPDPGFESTSALTSFASAGQGLSFQWRHDRSGTGAQAYRATGKARGGARRMVIGVDGTGSTATVGRVYSPSFKVEAAKTYRVNWYALANGAGATGVNVPKLTVEAVFGPAANTLNAAAPVAVSDGPVTNPPYTAYSAITFESYEQDGGDLIIGAGATDLFCSLRFTATNNAADCLIYLDDVSVVEVGAGGASELTSAGLRLFDDNGDEQSAFVSNRPNTWQIQKAGEVVASGTKDGDVFGQNLVVNKDVMFDGAPLLGRYKDIFLNKGSYDTGYDAGRDFESEPVGVAESLAGGIAARGFFGGSTFSNPTIAPANGFQKLFQINADLDIGRWYTFMMSPLMVNITGTTTAALLVKANFDGSNPNTASTLIARCYVTGTGFQSLTIPARGIAGAANQRDARFLVYLQNTGASGAGSFTLVNQDNLTCEIVDLGYAPENNAITVINTYTAPAAGETATAGVKKTYVTTWTASASDSYGAFGARSENNLFQGYYSTNQGHQWASIVFGGSTSTGGQNTPLATAMGGGAIVKKVELYVKNDQWYNNSGGTAVVRAQTSTGLITSTPGGTAKNFAMDSGEGRWLDITSIAAGLTGGAAAIRGVTLGKAPSTSRAYYGQFRNHTDPSTTYRPKLRVTYSK